MKKILFPILALVLAIGLAVPMASPAAAHTESDPQEVDLLAGQTMDVGEVKVWNDETNLYVTYEITDPDWVITETHLYVGKNNPNTLTTAPGQFPYDDDDATSVTDTMVSYVIPLADIDAYHMQLNKQGKETGVMVADGNPGVEPCNDVYIAAQAEVEKCVVESFEFTPVLTWQRSSETSVAVYPGYGAQWTWAQGDAIALDPQALVWDGGTGSQYFTGYSTRNDISWASWACTQPGTPSTTGTDLRRFQATFDIPAGYSVTGGTLGSVNPGCTDAIPINDNIYIFINGNLSFWGGTISVLDPTRTHFLGIERRPVQSQHSHIPDFPETDGWYMNGTFPAIPEGMFQAGPNVLDVFAEEFWTGGGMHELGLTLDVEQITCETETAWGEGTDFNHPNWAMYFEYHVQCMPGTLWQIGKPDGPVNPVDGSSEFPVTGTISNPGSWVWYATYDYTVGVDGDPINSPTAPGYIGTDNVREFVPSSDTRPPTDSTQELNILFTLACSFDAGELVLYYDRYGSETDTIRLDGVIIATVSATEGGYQAFIIPLPAVGSGSHTLTIAYEGGGSNNGHYIDYLKLVYE